jgi:hypothetical protein
MVWWRAPERGIAKRFSRDNPPPPARWCSIGRVISLTMSSLQTRDLPEALPRLLLHRAQAWLITP